MRILTWNVQYGKSSNGSSDFLRTLNYIKSLGEFDLICLQELARNMKEYCLQEQKDHVKLTREFYPDYSAVWGTGFSWPGTDGGMSERQEFGNLTLIKSVPLDHKVHLLPLPAAPGNKQMQRVAVEAVVDSKFGPLSIINTHLAFHDSNETQLQLERLYHLEKERGAQHRSPKLVDIGTYQNGYLACARIMCGDFNLAPDSSHYQYQIQKKWIDAWCHRHGDKDRLPTCGIFDSKQWPEGAHCRDYFWLSREFEFSELKIDVDTGTDLSDHQPVILELSI